MCDCVLWAEFTLNIQESFVDGMKVISESGHEYKVKEEKKKWLTNPLKAFTRKMEKSNANQLRIVADGI